MAPSTKKPNLDIDLKGIIPHDKPLILHLLKIQIDYLELSKVVFDWADSYDAKVFNFINHYFFPLPS